MEISKSIEFVVLSKIIVGCMHIPIAPSLIKKDALKCLDRYSIEDGLFDFLRVRLLQSLHGHLERVDCLSIPTKIVGRYQGA